MTTKRMCKYPGCTYYDKKAKHYCCGACMSDHYDYERLKKEKIMDKIKREWSYKTSDGKLFTGKFAAKKAKEYQKRLNFRESINNLAAGAREIFNVDKPNRQEDGKTDEELLIEKLNDKFGWDIDSFEEFLHELVTMYLEIPELSKFFQFVEEKFDEYK